ncbi:MAG: EpsG family protein [Oscillospiraceae bacterium]|nr:EpsG family protein [Oscillospiraceae bacterium]
MIAGVALLILAMFRANTVGTDLANYTRSFNNIRAGIAENYEPAYVALQFLVTRVTGNFNIFIAICSILSLIPILCVIYHEYDKYLWLGILAFIPFYITSFSLLRAFLALACLLVAYHATNDSKRRLVFWSFALLAILFHYTAIVVVAALLIFNRRYSYYWYVLAALAFCLLYFAGDLIYSILSPFSARLQQYYDFQGTYAPVNIFFYGMMTVLSYIYYKPLTRSDSRNIILINMMIFMLGFNITCIWVPVYGRVVQMFNLLAIFLVPEIIKCEKDKKIRVFYQIAFAVFYIFIFANTLLIDSSGIVPYRFFWGE